MGDWELLYLAFVLLLALESLVWRRKGEIFFARTWWGAWRFKLDPIVVKPLLQRVPLLRLPLPLGQNFKTAELLDRLKQARKALRLWRWLAAVLALWIYLVLPWIYFTWPAPAALGLGMLVMLCLWQATAVSLWLAKRRMASKDSIWAAFLTPISALRGSDLLSPNLVQGYHGLAIAQALLPAVEFEKIALHAWRSLHRGWHKSQLWPAEQLEGQAWAAWLQKQGLDLEQALAQPLAQSGAIVWCPRCLAQYREQRENCADCEFQTKLFA